MKNFAKKIAISAALETIAFLRLGNLFPQMAGRGIIFTLHHVRPKKLGSFAPNAHLEITPEFLEQVILVAKNAGLKAIHLQDLPHLLQYGDPTARYVCYTLDDGYRNNAEFAAPLFQKHNIPHTVFACPGFVDRQTTMWWETVAALLERTSAIRFDFGNGLESFTTKTAREKSDAFDRFAHFIATSDELDAVASINNLAQSLGFDPMSIVDKEIMTRDELKNMATNGLCTIGAHSMRHLNLARLSQEDMLHEISQSRATISKYIEKPVISFAYPYGWSRAAGEREFDAANNEGLTVAVTTTPAVLSVNDAHTPYALHRVSLNGFYQKKRYVAALISGFPFIF